VLGKLWRNHSLTLVCWIGGFVSTGVAWTFEAGPAFDTFLGFGQGMLTVALFYTLAGPLRERNKPEEPPK
jgi:hypothetical protein